MSKDTKHRVTNTSALEDWIHRVHALIKQNPNPEYWYLKIKEKFDPIVNGWEEFYKNFADFDVSNCVENEFI